MLYPKSHPYSWPTIGSMEDLTAASRDDVAEFFKTYYAPNNASLVIAGDIDLAATRAAGREVVQRDPARTGGAADRAAGGRPRQRQEADADRSCPAAAALSRVAHAARCSSPATPPWTSLSSLLTGGKNARLYKRLVYDLQIAQDVNAFQQSQALGSVFVIIATARPGQTLEKIQQVIDEELDKLRTTPADDREMARVMNQIEANFYRQMERVGGFGGKADQLNAYYTRTGMPDFFEEDICALPRR